MRWNSPITPNTGDTRTRVVFALLPTPTNSGQTVWLERVVITESYSYSSFDGGAWDVVSVSPKDAA